MAILWSLIVIWLTVCNAAPPAEENDSLEGALEVINRRQRDLSDPSLYYLDHFSPPRDVIYPHHGVDGQPEDIGYGYQKSLAPKTSGIFEAIPLPESELGSHDPGVETTLPEENIDQVFLDYIERNLINSGKLDPHRHHYHTQNPSMKRSVFRERDVNVLPSDLQNLYSLEENSDQIFENDEHPPGLPSSFREKTKTSRNNPFKTYSLVRNFGGLNRDSEHSEDNGNDPDEYLSMLNTIWEKYQDENPDVIDPEDLSESDVRNIVEYLMRKDSINKRQRDDSYENGFDFFNSPLAWVKRDRESFSNTPRRFSDDFFHVLKMMNDHHDSLREEDVPDNEKELEVSRLLMEQQPLNYKQYKRFWRGNSYEDHHQNAKRYPVTKRSLYSMPAYHNKASRLINQRRKKNAVNSGSSVTDPKVAKELDNIFSPSDETAANGKLNNTSIVVNSQSESSLKPNKTTNSTELKHAVKKDYKELKKLTQKKKLGEKEETLIQSQEKPLKVSKKSVDLSNYFGIDKRRKKSINPEKDEWLLDQYLKTYLITTKVKNPNGEAEAVVSKGVEPVDDMDSKLQAMEDMIVDQALKYTGAHEGITNPDEVNEVNSHVMSQLLAAFSLEKMREALREFKSSIAVPKAAAVPSHTTTNAPIEAIEPKEKKGAMTMVKDNLPDGDLEELTEGRPYHTPMAKTFQIEVCPIIDRIMYRCKMIGMIAKDVSNHLQLLCSANELCHLCGEEMKSSPEECDRQFIRDSDLWCIDVGCSPQLVQDTFIIMKSFSPDPDISTCDWQSHPCLSRHIQNTLRGYSTDP